MEDISLVLRFVFGTIFFTAGWSKIRQINQHILIVQEYRLLPKQIIYPASWLEILLELLSGTLLFLGAWQQYAIIVVGLLLVVYIVAISINLFRGRNEISCGCGGVAGTHYLTWWLVVRNLLLLFLGYWLFHHPTNQGEILSGHFYNWNLRTLTFLIVSWIIIIALMAGSETISIKRRITFLIHYDGTKE